MFSNTARKQSHTYNVKKSRADHIFLAQGNNTALQPVWFYVMVHPNKLRSFKAQAGAAMLDLSQYGQILYSGMGEAPSEIVRWLMKTRYGFTA